MSGVLKMHNNKHGKWSNQSKLDGTYHVQLSPWYVVNWETFVESK